MALSFTEHSFVARSNITQATVIVIFAIEHKHLSFSSNQTVPTAQPSVNLLTPLPSQSTTRFALNKTPHQTTTTNNKTT
jgi:hypothetical protein